MIILYIMTLQMLLLYYVEPFSQRSLSGNAATMSRNFVILITLANIARNLKKTLNPSTCDSATF